MLMRRPKQVDLSLVYETIMEKFLETEEDLEGRATFLSIAWHLWKSRGELFPTATAINKLTQQATRETMESNLNSEGGEGK